MLIDNTLLLREKFPAIRAYFLEHNEDLSLESFAVLDSRSGPKTIRYQQNENKSFMLHSAYDPLREAERIIASHKDKIKENTHVFFYGIGMGYHIEQFLELFPNQTYSIYEPIPEVFYQMAKHKNLEKIISKNIRKLYIDQHDRHNNSYFEEFNTSNQNIHLIVLPSYQNIVPEKFELFHKNIRETILYRRTKLKTDVSFQKLWVMNSLINFKTVLNTPNMLKDINYSCFEGKPAIIVAAGPSLAEDIEHLRYIKENSLAYIFSVGSAINSLIEFDVLPDAVFTYDPGLINHKVFEKMIEHDISHIPMVFGTSVGFETIRKYKGPKVHFITSQDRTSQYFLNEQLNVEHDLILDSPSIAVMTFQILNKLKASPIIFAGQNLGYLYDRLYSKGINYDHIKSELSKEQLEKLPTTVDVYGNKINTSISFNSMRKSIEGYVKKYSENTFINTTKGGAKIKGVPFQPIEEVIEKVLTHSIDKTKWWDEINDYNKSNIKGQFDKLTESIAKFSEIINALEKHMDSINQHTKIRNETKILDNLRKLDKLYKKLKENLYYNNFLSYYIRTHVQFVDNEIRRMNLEKNVNLKGEKAVTVFKRFIVQCRNGSYELENFIKNTLSSI